MNRWITLDGKKYATPAQAWQPLIAKSAQVRYNLDGSTDVTYGPAVPFEWIGQIIGPVTPEDSSWGDIHELKASLGKQETLAFIDHYGDAYNVAIVGPIVAESKSPKWDAPTNEFLVATRLIRIYA